MKNLLLLFTLTFLSYSSTAQCVETATQFGNNTNIPMYNISGEVVVTLNPGGDDISLDLGADFMTAAGPDIRAFLVNSNGLSDTQLTNTPIANLENFEFGLVGSGTTNQNGAKSFTVPVPTGVDLGNYDKIFFYCLLFDQFWDFGTINPFTPGSCAILSIESNALETVALYPNPASEVINISGRTNEIEEIRIFDGLGKQVFLRKGNTTDNINVSNLDTGLYFVALTANNQTTTKKIIIR